MNKDQKLEDIKMSNHKSMLMNRNDNSIDANWWSSHNNAWFNHKFAIYHRCTKTHTTDWTLFI